MPLRSHLKVGVDVPWVTSWSLETVADVRPCPSVDGVLAVQQVHRPGQGKPLYSRNHLFRQRQSVRSMLCPMCGQPTEAGDRWSQTGRYTTAGALRGRGFGPDLPAELPDARRLLNAAAIAPLHHACAARALLHCPHLRGMDDRTLKPFPNTWVIIPLMVEVKRPAGSGGSPRPNAAAVSFLQLVGVTDDLDTAAAPDAAPAA